MTHALALFFLLFTTLARADFIAGFGLQGGELASANTDSGETRVLRSPLIGFKGEIDFNFSVLSLFGSFDYAGGRGRR